MRRPPHPTGKVFVDHPDEAPHLDLANAIYGLLLQLIVPSFGRTGRDAARAQRAHLDAAIALMPATRGTDRKGVSLNPSNIGHAKVVLRTYLTFASSQHGPRHKQCYDRRNGRTYPDNSHVHCHGGIGLMTPASLHVGLGAHRAARPYPQGRLRPA